jgi:hypothetical protein
VVDEELGLEAVGREPSRPRDHRGVVDEHVEALVAVSELLGEAADGFPRGEVGGQKVHVRIAAALDNVQPRLAPPLLVARDNRDARAHARDADGRGLADAGRRARDENDTALHLASS